MTTSEPISQPQRLTPHAERAIPRDAIRCGGCDRYWTGASTCHCGSCHETFSRLRNFDRHRRGGVCHDPADVGLHLTGRAYPCWVAADDRYLTLSDEETS